MEIVLNNVVKTLKRKKVLDNINLCFSGAKIYGLEGVNGSGKTMLMRACLGLIKPEKGVVTVNGKDIFSKGKFIKECGFLLENPAFLDDYSALTNLMMLAQIRKLVTEAELRALLRKVGLNPDSKKRYGKFSLGMKQRLGIAAAFMENPELVVLDEPTNALDQAGMQLVYAMLMEHRAKGGLAIISCHDRQFLYAVADEIIQIEEGKVIRQFSKTEAPAPLVFGN